MHKKLAPDTNIITRVVEVVGGEYEDVNVDDLLATCDALGVEPVELL
ncbi:hypothetical protein [Agromyces aureus]|nr:hypothetical protein [Agromyces aureus]